MKKSLKNTIMIGMAAVLIGTSAITFSYAQISDHAAAPQMSISQFEQDGKQGFKGQKPDFNQGNGDSSNMPQPPQNDAQQNAPDNNAQQGENNQQNQMPEQNEQSQQDSNQQSAQGDSKQNSSSNTGASLENEEAEIEELSAQNENNDSNMKMAPSHTDSKLTTLLCYAFLAVQLAIILMIIAYLIISKFNAKSFNQVFPENKEQQI